MASLSENINQTLQQDTIQKDTMQKDTIQKDTIQQDTIQKNTQDTIQKKIKVAIDTVCYQLINNSDIITIWETLFNYLPANKDNTHYEITLLQRTQANGATYQFKPELNLDKKFSIKKIPDFNYMNMNQDVDTLNYICKIEKFDVFISTSFTYCNSIPTILLINDMKPELNIQQQQPRTPIIIQKEKAILNASAFITFINKKASIDLHHFYPHIKQNNIPVEIIIHTTQSISNNNEKNFSSSSSKSTTIYKSLDTYLSSLETILLKPEPFINIIIQSYKETNTERLKELVYCFKQNLHNPYVKMIYDFGTGIKSGESSESSEEIGKKYKLVDNPENKWLTFEMAINYANTVSETKNETIGNYWCIMNLDIFLDDKSFWNTIRGQLNNGFIYAQSRHEVIDTNTESNLKGHLKGQMDPNFAKLYHANTQDAWLFKTPLECNNKNIDFNFELGFLGCDNAIADRLYKSGYKVINQPMTYKIFHYDIVKGKTSSNYLEKHKKETKEMTEKMVKPKNKYPERKGSYLVPNYDQMLSGNGNSNGKDIDLIGFINQLGGCSNWERYEFISRLFRDRIIINNP